MNPCDRIRVLHSLAAAGALDPDDDGRVALHLQTCTICSAEFDNWQDLARGLRRIPTPPPPPSVVERARARAALAFGEEAERRWNRNVLVFVVAFAWLLTALSWPLVRFVTGGLESWFSVPFASEWYAFAGLTAIGWLAAGVAATMLAWHQRGERRLA